MNMRHQGESGGRNTRKLQDLWELDAPESEAGLCRQQEAYAKVLGSSSRVGVARRLLRATVSREAGTVEIHWMC